MDNKQECAEVLKMSPTEAEDQISVIKKARALQRRILARRGGEPLPPAWQDLIEAREEQSASP